MRGEQSGHPSDPSDIDVAIFPTEAEPCREMRSHVVTVEHLDPFACGVQVASQSMGDGGLSS
jgi:hypothetical protein